MTCWKCGTETDRPSKARPERGYCKKCLQRNQRNAAARARNQILRDICGTSARAAREDMGL